MAIALKPLQLKWLRDIGKSKDGKLSFHLDHKRDQNALTYLLDHKMIKIDTAFEGGLYLVSITDEGRRHI